MHESVHVDGPAGRLQHELLHYSYRDLRDHLDRINRYSTLAARQMLENGRRAGVIDLLLHPPAAGRYTLTVDLLHWITERVLFTRKITINAE